MTKKNLSKATKVEKVVPVEEKKVSNFSTIFLFIILIGAIFTYNFYNPVDYKNNLNNVFVNSNLDNQLGVIQRFNSSEDLKVFLEKSKETLGLSSNSINFLGNEERLIVQSDSVGMNKAVGTNVAENTPSSNVDYSKTNNQVKNVDEADIVKTDGKYIYTLSGNKLVIVNIFPSSNLNISSTINFNKSENPQNLFIYNKTLVVFTNSYEKQEKISSNSFLPENYYIQKTNAEIFDLNNIEKPKLIKKFSLTGYFTDARLIKNNVYFISKQRVNNYNNIIMPMVFRDNVKIAMPSVYYFGIPFNSYNFNNVASLNLDDLSKNISVKSFMLGYSNTIYFSENNIYITYPKYYKYDRFAVLDKVVIPLLPKSIQEKILGLNDSLKNNLNIYNEDVVGILENYYNSLSEKDKDNLFSEIKKNTQEYYYNLEIQRDNTIIEKISIDNGKIKYVGKGQVRGHLLNQFSLDEDKNLNLRVATTTSVWDRKNDKREVYNNVFVLNKNLKQIGNLTNFAQDEKIYSTRFIGDKLYLVSFKQIDPLFVIDLSNSKNPKILGELKLPGYSTYLQAYDKTHLIGIGYDTKESEWGGIVNNGVKLSLFDIGDFNNPKLIDDYIIKGRFTDSIALHEHKAFLFSKDKHLISMPIREFVGDQKKGIYQYNTGAFVFNVNESGFKLKGKIIQENSEKGQSYWYNLPSSVKRSLYIGNTLYTVSDKYIYANNLSNLKDESKLILGYNGSYNRYPIYY